MAWFGQLHRQQAPLARFENIVPEDYMLAYFHLENEE